MGRMGRPRLPVGSYGKISTTRLGKGKVKARTRLRGHDGKTVEVTRQGSSVQTAEQAVKAACAELLTATGTTLTPDTKLAAVAESWLSDLERQVRAGEFAEGTLRSYRSNWNNHLAPALGELACREIKVVHCQRAFDAMAAKGLSAGARRVCRNVLSGVCQHAIVADAMTTNPAKGMLQIKTPKAEKGTKKDATLTTAEMDAWFHFLATDKASITADLPDLAALLLGTGVRISELFAVRIEEIDLAAGTIPVRHHIVRTEGGVTRVPGLKAGGERDLNLPTWALAVIQRRITRLGEMGPLFPPARNDGYRNPNNTSTQFKNALERASKAETALTKLTSHDFRHYVLTSLVEGGLSIKDAADQAGHGDQRTTQDYYVGRNRLGDRALSYLEALNPMRDNDEGDALAS